LTEPLGDQLSLRSFSFVPVALVVEIVEIGNGTVMPAGNAAGHGGFHGYKPIVTIASQPPGARFSAWLERPQFTSAGS